MPHGEDSAKIYGMADYAQVRKVTRFHRLVLVFHGGDCVLSEEV